MIALTARGQVLADVLDGHEVTIGRAKMIDLCHDLAALTPRLAAICNNDQPGAWKCVLSGQSIGHRPEAAQVRWRKVPRIARMIAGRA